MAAGEHFRDRWPVAGYAIVSRDGMIADRNGLYPDSLRDDADWEMFQSELDRSAVTVLGRLSHEAAPNTRNRLRVVVTGSSPGLVRAADAYRWNPGAVPADRMLEEVLPQGGRVAVPGGRRVFDLFLRRGYAEFHLTRRATVTLPGGVPVFSAVTTNADPEAVLARSGMALAARRPLASGTELSVWTAERSHPAVRKADQPGSAPASWP